MLRSLFFFGFLFSLTSAQAGHSWGPPRDDLAGLHATEIAAGDSHTCAVLSNQRVACWGSNFDFELGRRDVPDYVASDVCKSGGRPDLEGDCATDVPGYVRTREDAPLEGVVQVSAGGLTTCARLATGRVACWGRNENGQLGSPSLRNGVREGSDHAEFADSPHPVEVEGISAATQVEVANEGDFACAVEGSALRCWGSNRYRTLGREVEGRCVYGLQCSAAPVTVPVGPVAQVALGTDFACALLTTGKVSCWGGGFYGETGRGAPRSLGFARGDGFQLSLPPGEIPGLEGIVEIAAGGFHACARSAAGEVSCWGLARDGAAGRRTGETCDLIEDNRNACVSRPQRIEGVAGAVELALGTFHSCARVRADSGATEVRCWGDNRDGQLAVLTRSGRSEVARPYDQFLGLPLPGAITALAAGHSHNCVLSGEGSVFCWGGSSHGQLGWLPVYGRREQTDPIRFAAELYDMLVRNP